MAAMTLVNPATIWPQQQPPLPISSFLEWYAIMDMVVVSGRRLLLTDWEHRSVLLVDSQVGGVLSRVNVPCVPCGVCMVHVASAAVTQPYDKRFQYVHVNGDSLTLGNVVAVGGDVRGVNVLRNRLVVTYQEPPAVEVVTQEGKRLHRLDRGLFRHPEYVTVSGDRVFVSDWGTNAITMLSDQLQLLATFSQPDLLNQPKGIISLNDDQLLVCGWRSDNIVLLKPSSGRMSAILERKGGVKLPFALAFCHHSRTLYLTRDCTTSIQRYRLE